MLELVQFSDFKTQCGAETGRTGVVPSEYSQQKHCGDAIYACTNLCMWDSQFLKVRPPSAPPVLCIVNIDRFVQSIRIGN